MPLVQIIFEVILTLTGIKKGSFITALVWSIHDVIIAPDVVSLPTLKVQIQARLNLLGHVARHKSFLQSASVVRQ
jgi:hypothetical protein